MRIHLYSVGTRGDIEPFLTLAELLAKRGHEILCVFPEQFRELTESLGHRFEGFPEEFLEMIQSSEGKQLMGGEGNRIKRIGSVIGMAKKGISVQREIINIQHRLLTTENPDLALSHPKALFTSIWGMANPGKSMMVSPLPLIAHPVDHQTTIGIGGSGNFGTTINRSSFWLVNTIRSTVIRKFAKHTFADFPGVRYSARRIYRFLIKQEKALYLISPTLFPRPDYWPENVNVAGYFERDKTIDWQPDANLTAFLDRFNNDKVLFISFGSMVNNNPEQKTEAVVQALSKHKIPTIINTSWGGLRRPESFPDHLHFAENLPYDWIFPRVHAVIHHGGSGTTHTALKYGCASMAVPHIVDQFYWNKVIAEKGAGPLGMPIKKLDAKRFEAKVLDLMTNSSYKKRAEELGASIRSESDADRLYDLICG